MQQTVALKDGVTAAPVALLAKAAMGSSSTAIVNSVDAVVQEGTHRCNALGPPPAAQYGLAEASWQQPIQPVPASVPQNTVTMGLQYDQVAQLQWAAYYGQQQGHAFAPSSWPGYSLEQQAQYLSMQQLQQHQGYVANPYATGSWVASHSMAVPQPQCLQPYSSLPTAQPQQQLWSQQSLQPQPNIQLHMCDVSSRTPALAPVKIWADHEVGAVGSTATAAFDDHSRSGQQLDQNQHTAGVAYGGESAACHGNSQSAASATLTIAQGTVDPKSQPLPTCAQSRGYSSIRNKWGAQPSPLVSHVVTSSAVQPDAVPVFHRVGVPGPKPPSTPPPAPQPTAPTAEITPATAVSSQFPPSFAAWVERCFQAHLSDEHRTVMTAKLQRKITEVKAMGRLWVVDWDRQPIPSVTMSDSDNNEVPTAAARDGSLQGRPSHKREREAVNDGAGSGEWGGRRQGRAQEGSGSRDHGNKSWMRNDDQAAVSPVYGTALHAKPLTKKQRKAAVVAQQRQLRIRNGAPAVEAGADSAVDALHGSASEEQRRRDTRAGRFGDGRAFAGGGEMRAPWHRSAGHDGSEADSGDELDMSSLGVIRGTSIELEKSYYRLTAAPDPALVRPEPVLQAALQRLLALVASGAVGYFYICDQLKGMRQDLTVQRLRSSTAIAVYEAHARAALEYGDLAEFNQCQTQLHTILYRQCMAICAPSNGPCRPGSADSGHVFSAVSSALAAPFVARTSNGEHLDGSGTACKSEFMAYMVLYQTVHASRDGGAAKALLSAMQAAMACEALAGAPEVVHALRVRQAVMGSAFGEFFDLYSAAPGLGRAILDAAAPKVRWAALNTFTKVYKTSIPVAFLSSLLGFTPRSSNLSTPVQLHRDCVAGASTANHELGAASKDALETAALPASNLAAAHSGGFAYRSTAPHCATPGAPLLCSQPLPGCSVVMYRGRFAAENSMAAGLQACIAWLLAHGAVLEQGTTEQLLDCKASLGQLRLPEPPKVAHGDENLSLDDFLTRASMRL